MKEQLLVVWDDLRDRRLWPVAAFLLLALVAVPVVLVKPAEETPSQAATPTTATGTGDPLAKQAVVKAFDAKPLVKISRLDQFSAKDPFKPIEQLVPIKGAEAIAKATGGSLSGGAGGGATAPTTGGGGDTSIPTTGGGGTTTPTAPTTPTTPKTKKFTYVVDLSFGQEGSAQRYRGFDRLGMLPNQSAPLLVYLGVDGTGTQAAFLVDSTLTADGEGTCKPSASNCGVVYLQSGERETFADGEGHSYELVIDQIRKQEIKAKGSAKKAKRAAKSDEATQAPRRFLLPVLIDLETGGHS
jgi:hypothetical protein